MTQAKILSLKPQLIANPNSTFFKKSGYTAIVCNLSQDTEPKYLLDKNGKQLKQSELRCLETRKIGILACYRSHQNARNRVYAQQWPSLSRDLHRLALACGENLGR